MDMETCEELKARNLEAFSDRQPALYDGLIAYQPLAKFVITDDDQPDVILDGEYFYSKKHDSYIRDQLKSYWLNPTAFNLFPPTPDNTDQYGGEFIDAMMRRAVDEDITFHTHRQTSEAYFLVIFGFGLGGFVNDLVEKFNPQCVIVAEPNLEFIYHSLMVFDWAAFFDMIDERKGDFRILIAATPEDLTYNIRQSLRGTSPCTIDGMAWYLHYNAPVLNSSLQKMRDDSDLIITGLGFMYDETLMLGNTHRNLRGGKAKVYLRPNGGRQDTPVFVIGCGPSLDSDLDAIAANADKAVIVSCGSAIGPLASRGIVPDFQIETENLNIFTIMEKIWEKIDLKKVCLIASSTADPEINPLFDRIVYYFRSALSPYPIFSASERHVILHSSPTVVNAGLSFAQELGFQEIYLFGADMGVKDENMHHAANSYHYTENAILYKHNYNIKIQGNFGGKVLTSSSFYWARDAITLSIRQNKRGVRHFNCSDGAEINLCQPKPARSLKLNEISGGKAKIIDDIFGTFPEYGQEEFERVWNDGDMRDNMNGYLDNIRDTVKEADDFSDPAFLREIYRYLIPGVGLGGKEQVTRMSTSMALLFRGTFFMMIISLLYYRHRIGDEKKEVIFEGIIRDAFLDTIENMRTYVLEHVGFLTERANEEETKVDREDGTTATATV